MSPSVQELIDRLGPPPAAVCRDWELQLQRLIAAAAREDALRGTSTPDHGEAGEAAPWSWAEFQVDGAGHLIPQRPLREPVELRRLRDDLRRWLADAVGQADANDTVADSRLPQDNAAPLEPSCQTTDDQPAGEEARLAPSDWASSGVARGRRKGQRPKSRRMPMLLGAGLALGGAVAVFLVGRWSESGPESDRESSSSNLVTLDSKSARQGDWPPAGGRDEEGASGQSHETVLMSESTDIEATAFPMDGQGTNMELALAAVDVADLPGAGEHDTAADPRAVAVAPPLTTATATAAGEGAETAGTDVSVAIGPTPQATDQEHGTVDPMQQIADLTSQIQRDEEKTSPTSTVAGTTGEQGAEVILPMDKFVHRIRIEAASSPQHPVGGGAWMATLRAVEGVRIAPPDGQLITRRQPALWLLAREDAGEADAMVRLHARLVGGRHDTIEFRLEATSAMFPAVRLPLASQWLERLEMHLDSTHRSLGMLAEQMKVAAGEGHRSVQALAKSRREELKAQLALAEQLLEVVRSAHRLRDVLDGQIVVHLVSPATDGTDD
ncbi:MAG: hypothetical protein KatS3mg111_1314 [Pirellulaceae bacterium]|nr:MAG: hypothetical protein KatS3mg111_1314 [Pirellulaceae bacterium]